jgi:DNA-binding NarL/FixJ family response regulator
MIFSGANNIKYESAEQLIVRTISTMRERVIIFRIGATLPLPQILIIEDDGLIALDIHATISCLKIDVVGHAFDGESGHRMALLHMPDLIVMDIHLGRGIDGIETALRIHRDICTRIFFLSASLDGQMLERAKAARMHGYLRKPFGGPDLQRGITAALAMAA